ncbi:hypothetical protein HCU74_08410 [Spongiibacter sp. KMU-166]|uniref:Uncharacterized protein n=1 Tax=Spongiibacter thalassae TaxID=2721624 RepID=A0ABX1GFW6_9GAMM|nr:hypothetical protein [Spongiibacter thalassae]NKI17438.1 hypothetical protein [Spongiibacter thalassae]
MFKPLFRTAFAAVDRHLLPVEGVSLLEQVQALISSHGGVLYTNDLSTMFQDEAGTQPVTSPGDPIALWLDSGQGGLGSLGVERVTNGDFSSGETGFTELGGNSITVAGGQATLSRAVGGSEPVVSFSVDTEAGKSYLISVDVIDRSDMGANAFGVYADDVALLSTTASGVSQLLFHASATETATWQLRIMGGTPLTSSRDIVIDELSVREVPGHHAVQTTAAAQPVLQQDGSAFYYLDFDGVDDLLAGLNSVTLSQPSTVSICFSVPAAGTSRPLLSGTSPNRHNMTINGTDHPLIFAGGSLVDTDTTIAVNVPYIFTAEFNGPSSSIRINKSQTAGGGAGTEGLSGLSIGAGGGGSPPSEASVYAVAIVSGVLSASEMAVLEDYIESLY